jgi:MOSC domain-containing protein YiiM
VIAVHASPTHAFSKQMTGMIELIAGRGVAGDAHCGETVQHRSRVARDPTQPNLRQVHLMHAEIFTALASSGYAIEPGLLGENITTRGIDLLALPEDAELRIGRDVVLRVTGLRNPCGQLNGIQPGLMDALRVHTPEGKLIRKAGIMSVVLEGGVVRAGDTIRVRLPDGPQRALAPV